MPDLMQWNLVADIGGTNARFALHDISRDELTEITVLTVAEHPNFIEGIQYFIQIISKTGSWKQMPESVCLAVACPVDNDLVQFTNSHWSFSKKDLSTELDNIPVDVINDFSAIAYSIIAINPDQYESLGEGSAVPGKPIAILGPGTGLGMCTLVPDGEGYIVMDGEGGHMDFAPSSHIEIAILNELKNQYQRVSVERLLSGSGIVNIYQALCKLKSLKATLTTAREISTAAMAGNDQAAVETMALFCRILGSTAGNLALILGAKGGVYIAGGIPPKIIDFIRKSDCRVQFDNKGRFRSYIKNIPLRVLLQDQPGLQGAVQKIKLNNSRLE